MHGVLDVVVVFDAVVHGDVVCDVVVEVVVCVDDVVVLVVVDGAGQDWPFAFS